MAPVVKVSCKSRVAMEDKMVVVPRQLDRSYHSSGPQFLGSFDGKDLDYIAKAIFGCRFTAIIFDPHSGMLVA